MAPFWKPPCDRWKSGAHFIPKVQHLGLMSGENRQELAHEMKIRMRRFLSDETPLKRGERPSILTDDGRRVRMMVRKAQILCEKTGVKSDDTESFKWLVDHCIPPSFDIEPSESVLDQASKLLIEWVPTDTVPRNLRSLRSNISEIPPCLPSPSRNGQFWIYDSEMNQHFMARITPRNRKPLETSSTKVTLELRCGETGRVYTEERDANDIDILIRNGTSRELSKFAHNCRLCDVCLISCHFVDETVTDSEPPSLIELDDIKRERPSLICSGCSSVVHVDCVWIPERFEFNGRALLREIVRTGRDWFCSKCLDNPESCHKGILKYGYEAGEDTTRQNFERRGKAFKLKHGIPDMDTTVGPKRRLTVATPCAVKSPSSGSRCMAPKRRLTVASKPPSSLSPLTAKSKKDNGRTIDAMEIEKLFWSMVDAEGSEETTVLYASDMDSSIVGGKGEKEAVSLDDQDRSWELRYLATNRQSVLRHLPGADKIEGVSRPWMYLGTPFSSFCWHTEDQFLWSVTYLHEGAAKVWYTIPGNEREKFEEALACLVPDLVQLNSDLHHQLVTLIDPITLCSHPFNIRVAKIVQQPGEFVITFPGAYHAGFNTGSNLAEAVNVAIPAWLPAGHRAIRSYASVGRPSVFCLEELAWKTAEAVLQNGTETRRPVVEFCIDVLTCIGEMISRTSNRSSQPVTMVMDDKPVCADCNQFCYFFVCGFEDGSVCGNCAEKRSDQLMVRSSVKYVEAQLNEVVERLIEKLDSCSEDVRRSIRSSKKIKTNISQ